MWIRFKAWLRARAVAKLEAQYNRGWNWAAGELLRGVQPQDLRRQVTDAFDYSEFDCGASAAIVRWTQFVRPRK